MEPANDDKANNHVMVGAILRWVVWIGLLIAVIMVVLPAIGARRGPRPANVRTEIANLQSALATFEHQYGTNPPSGIRLYARESDWEADPVSKAKIQKLWPQFNFQNCGGMSNLPPEGATLNGAEALVFFLSGVNHLETGFPIGFSRDPAEPFGQNKGQSREPAIYEFDPARFVDIDGDGFWEYCDTLGKCRSPLVYICNWLDQGYDKRDYSDFLDDVYRTGKGKDAKPWGRGGIQIISPGKDRRYGSGGYYNIEDENWWKSSPNRQADRDNYTSFCAGPLDGTLR